MKSVTMWLGGLAVVAIVSTIVYAGDIETWTGQGSRRNTVEFKINASSPGTAANLLPGTANTNSIGSSALPLKDVYTTDLSIADDLSVTGDISVTGDMAVTGSATLQRVTFGVQLSSAPKTSSTLVFNSTGTLVFNTQDGYLCVSTGSAKNSFVIVSSNTVTCAH